MPLYSIQLALSNPTDPAFSLNCRVCVVAVLVRSGRAHVVTARVRLSRQSAARRAAAAAAAACRRCRLSAAGRRSAAVNASSAAFTAAARAAQHKQLTVLTAAQLS